MLRLTFTIFFLSGWAAFALCADETAPLITTASNLFVRTYTDMAERGRPFMLTASVTLVCCERRHKTMAIADSSGAMLITLDKISTPITIRRGDVVEFSGIVTDDSFGHPCASCTSARIISNATNTPAVLHNPTDLSSVKHWYRVVKIEGLVIDAFLDEIDPNYMFLVLNYDGHRVTVATESEGQTDEFCRDLIGHRVSVLGVCRPNMYGARAYFGQNIRTIPENIKILPGKPHNPFAAQELCEQKLIRPNEITSVERRTVKGTVIASWSNGRSLVKTKSGQIVRIKIMHGNPPEQGQSVEASGFPETDLYRINLTRCLCRVTADAPVPEDRPLAVSARQLTSAPSGNQRYDTEYHGKFVRLTGRLLGYSPIEGSVEKALLESDGQHIPLYFAARHEISKSIPVNSQIEVDGTCVMDTESWSPYTFFPQIQEVFLSVAGPSRIRVVARPSWWTPEKFTAVCTALLLLLFAIILWNMTLNHAVTRKGKALKREITARLASNLKTRERTRLAVELHDSIAQTLSGTAMEIGSAIRCSGNASTEMLSHLQTASQTLRSCRDDLRDCLWDLRSNALEVGTMDEAIKTTLRPIIGDLTPIIRFNILRKRLSDNTAHALLRIIHELVSNAICHGHAQTIRIAGSLDGRRLLFSVRDDGCGFDVSDHPGAAAGHFGLEGIRERIRRFNGTMEIESSPKQGTKVSIALDVASPEEEDLIET